MAYRIIVRRLSQFVSIYTHGAYAALSSLPVERSSIEGKKEGYNFKGYFNGKLVKEETLYLDSNSSLLDLSLGNFNKDVSRVEKQAETSD